MPIGRYGVIENTRLSIPVSVMVYDFSKCQWWIDVRRQVLLVVQQSCVLYPANGFHCCVVCSQKPLWYTTSCLGRYIISAKHYGLSVTRVDGCVSDFSFERKTARDQTFAFGAVAPFPA